jgi:hypothetical protein
MCVQTGRIPGHGIQESNLGMTSQTECNANLTMIGKKLHGAGYFTAQIGKVRALIIILTAAVHTFKTSPRLLTSAWIFVNSCYL